MNYSLTTPYIGSFETRQLHHHYLANYNPAYGLLYDFHNNPHCLFVKLDMDPEEATLLALQLPNTIIKPFDPNIVADYLSSSLDEFLYSSPA